MGSTVATFIILGIYVAVMVSIGIYTAKRTKSTNDFMLGGRNVGSWLTAFSYGTTYFSAVVFIGYAGQFGWSYGVSATWIGIGNAIIGSLIPFFLIGKRTRLMTNHLGSKTMPDFFEKRFDSSSLKTVSALIVFIFLIPYTASVYNGLSNLFGMVFDLGANGGKIIIILMAVLSAIYVTLGGYKATALNDFFQGIIMLIGISTVVILTVQKKNGLTEAIDALNLVSDPKTPENTLGSLFGPDPINLLGVVILTSLGTWGLPQMVQKFYAIKNKEAIKKGAIISTFFAIVVAGGSYFMGGFVRLYCSGSEKEAAATGRAFIETGSNGKLKFDTMVPNLIQTALPNILIGLIVVLVLSASLSTLSSLVLTSSSTLTNDLIKPKVKNFTDKKQMLFIRIFIAVFLVISVIIACNPNSSITTLMSYSWGALSGAFLGPFLYSLFMKKASRAAVWASLCTGIGITLCHMILFGFGLFPDLAKEASSFKLNLASPINAGAIAMIVSLIIVPVVSCFTKPPKKEVVEDAFSSLEAKLD